jgi:hypothetical protein
VLVPWIWVGSRTIQDSADVQQKTLNFFWIAILTFFYCAVLVDIVIFICLEATLFEERQ